MLTKTEMAEELQLDIQDIVFEYSKSSGRDVFNRNFKELFDDFKVKLQEQIEQDIEDEEQDFVEEEVTDAEAFGNGIMEGE